jgi:hypothetical protein
MFTNYLHFGGDCHCVQIPSAAKNTELLLDRTNTLSLYNEHLLLLSTRYSPSHGL